MPPELDPNLTPSSSVTDVPASSSGAPDVTASSSDATKGDDTPSLAAAIQRAVDFKPENDADLLKQEPAPATEGEEAKADPSQRVPDTKADPKADGEAQKPEEPDPTPEEMRSYKPQTRQRIERLLSQRDEFRSEVERLKPVAEAHEQFVSYLETNNLSTEDTNLLLGLGAALRKGDFQTFLKGVTPYIQIAQEAVGERLPNDLQEQVEQGYVTEEVARELARTRHRAAHLETEVKARDTRAAEEERTQVVNTTRASITAWEQKVSQSDPDYPHKRDAVLRHAQAIIAQRGPPRSSDEAVAWAEEAYGEVNKLVGRVKPALQPTQRTPSGVQTASTAAPVPRTLMEAAMQGLLKARQA